MHPTVLVYTTRSTPALAGGCQQIARAIDVRPVQLLGVPGPQPVVRGNVEDQPATGHGAFQRGGVAQIPGDALHIEFLDAAARPYQRANRVPALAKQARDVPSEEPGSSRNQNRFHVRAANVRECEKDNPKLSNQFQPFEIFIRPARLGLDHRPQRLHFKGLAGPVK